VLLCYNLTLSLFSHPLLILFIEQSIQLITNNRNIVSQNVLVAVHSVIFI
jgi:hypothetical protein